MLELDQTLLTSDKARSLLRRLRDLNLSTSPIAVRAGGSIAIAGCLSLDAPVESGVRYLLRFEDGTEALLELLWRTVDLALTIRFEGHEAIAKSISIPLSCDRQGRACARLLAARVSPESRDRRKLEHFLRRVVRTLAR